MTSRCLPRLLPLMLFAAPAVSQPAFRVVESVPVPAGVQFGAPTSIQVPYSGSEPVVGVALDGLWTAVTSAGDGVAPWSLDMNVEVTPPGGQPALWSGPIFGDVTIADYPLQDASTDLFAGAGAGLYGFSFFNDPNSGFVSGLSGLTVHFTTASPAFSFAYTAQPSAANVWSRPFFIDGVSGLGPTNYDVLEFRVTESGGYRLQSVLGLVDDTFTFLYEGAFDPTLPLTDLLDYGLGNGFAPNGAPRGTSLIEVLLFEGVTYYWVTSTWRANSPLTPSANTIRGPGRVFDPAAGPPCSPADLATTGGVFGQLDFNDINTFVAGFLDDQPISDVAPPGGDGEWDFADINAFVAAFLLGCP